MTYNLFIQYVRLWKLSMSIGTLNLSSDYDDRVWQDLYLKDWRRMASKLKWRYYNDYTR